MAARADSTGLDWWTEPADEIDGHELVKDAALFALVGVPFIITRATYHAGIQRKGVTHQDDYVSLELRVAPAGHIASRMAAGRLSADAAAKIVPGEQLVINDGSTGIYRQVTQYLALKGLITLPPGAEEGEKGETVWDLPRSLWDAGAEDATKGIPIALRCSRGLRVSEYDNPTGGDAKARTWYLA